MNIAAGVLMIFVCVANLIVALYYFGIGSIFGFFTFVAAADGNITNSQDADAAGTVLTASGVIVAFGIFLVLLAIMELVACGMLFVERASKFIIGVAILEILADLTVIVTRGPGVWSLFGLIVAAIAIYAARLSTSSLPAPLGATPAPPIRPLQPAPTRPPPPAQVAPPAAAPARPRRPPPPGMQ